MFGKCSAVIMLLVGNVFALVGVVLWYVLLPGLIKKITVVLSKKKRKNKLKISHFFPTRTLRKLDGKSKNLTEQIYSLLYRVFIGL